MHKVDITLQACHAVEILQEAFAKFDKLKIVNTDQFSQFKARKAAATVRDQGCKLSVGGKDTWRDNMFVGRAERGVKYERVYLKASDAVGAARADITDYFG